jgi:hypothetical protein
MPQGHMYTGVFKGVAVTAQQDFFQIVAPSAASMIIHGWALSQETEFGDAQEEMLRLTTNRGTGAVTTGSGGTTPTATPSIRTSPAFGGTVKANNTTKLAAGSGTLTTDLEVHNWNERVPYLMIYTPEMRPVVLGGDYWTLELETTPADSVTVSGTIWFEVLG